MFLLLLHVMSNGAMHNQIWNTSTENASVPSKSKGLCGVAVRFPVRNIHAAWDLLSRDGASDSACLTFLRLGHASPVHAWALLWLSFMHATPTLLQPTPQEA